MIGRQVYRRDTLRVDFPQLEMVSGMQPLTQFHSNKKLYGDRKNRHSPVAFSSEGSDTQKRGSEQFIDASKIMLKQPLAISRLEGYPSPITPTRTPIVSSRLRHLRLELQLKNAEIQRLQLLRSHNRALPPPLEEPFARVKSLTPVREAGKRVEIGAEERKRSFAECGTRQMTPLLRKPFEMC